MFLFVLWHDERFILVHSDEKWTYYFPVRWLVLIHALAGLTALLIGPFQLASRFRERHLPLHRVMGRVYLSSVAIAAVMGMYVSSIHQRDRQDGLWVFALALTWLVTGAMAFAAVRNGNIEAHRQWITRNYAFTTVFVTVRVLSVLPVPDPYAEAAIWVLLLATLLFTDVGLSWRKRLYQPQVEARRLRARKCGEPSPSFEQRRGQPVDLVRTPASRSSLPASKP